MKPNEQNSENFRNNDGPWFLVGGFCKKPCSYKNVDAFLTSWVAATRLKVRWSQMTKNWICHSCNNMKQLALYDRGGCFKICFIWWLITFPRNKIKPRHILYKTQDNIKMEHTHNCLTFCQMYDLYYYCRILIKYFKLQPLKFIGVLHKFNKMMLLKMFMCCILLNQFYNKISSLDWVVYYLKLV